MEFLKRKEVIIIIILFILFLIFGGFFLFSYVNKEECICNDLSINKEKANEENDDKLINLEVKGEVKNPGVYSLKEDSIIKDQTTPNMIQRISGIFERKPLISREI